jgi:radical SAM protein with 4Fe4S-binding SPASM domain
MHSKEPIRFFFHMLKTPHILLRASKALYVKHVKTFQECKKHDGYCSLPPQQISVKITNVCNLRCKTCGQWGETGYNFHRSSSELREIVPVERYLQLSDEVKPYTPIYYIWGGEPFLYPGLFDFTDRIKQNKSLLAVVTNATMLTEQAKEVVEQRWDALMFSLDGPEPIHDEIRGRKGTFQKVAEGIEAVRKYKRDTKRHLPWVMALVTVSVDNAPWLDKIFEVGEQLNIDCMIVYYSWFTNEKIGNAHTKIMQQKLGITPTKWKGYLFNHDVDTATLVESIHRIRSQKWKFSHLFIPDLKTDAHIVDYYKTPGNFFGYGPCISPWFVTEVMPNGDVAPCRDYPDYITGNLLEQSIVEIWNGERYRKFRRALKENGGIFPICARCCGLMGW